MHVHDMAVNSQRTVDSFRVANWQPYAAKSNSRKTKKTNKIKIPNVDRAAGVITLTITSAFAFQNLTISSLVYIPDIPKISRTSTQKYFSYPANKQTDKRVSKRNSGDLCLMK